MYSARERCSWELSARNRGIRGRPGSGCVEKRREGGLTGLRRRRFGDAGGVVGASAHVARLGFPRHHVGRVVGGICGAEGDYQRVVLFRLETLCGFLDTMRYKYFSLRCDSACTPKLEQSLDLGAVKEDIQGGPGGRDSRWVCVCVAQEGDWCPRETSEARKGREVEFGRAVQAREG